MKIKNYLLMAGVSVCMGLFFLSCSNDDAGVTTPAPVPDDGIVTIQRVIEIPGDTRSYSVAAQPTITATINLQTEQVLSIAPSASLLQATQMTNAEFDSFLKEELGVYYYDLSVYPEDLPDITMYNQEKGTFQSFGDCMRAARQIPKKEGRGAAKVDCWWQLVRDIWNDIFG